MRTLIFKPLRILGARIRQVGLTTEDKRKIAESLVEKMVIGEGEIEIALSYLPSSEELCKTQQQLRGPG